MPLHLEGLAYPRCTRIGLFYVECFRYGLSVPPQTTNPASVSTLAVRSMQLESLQFIGKGLEKISYCRNKKFCTAQKSWPCTANWCLRVRGKG